MKIPLSQYVSIHPDVCHGKPVFRGTRIPVSLIIHMIEGGDSIVDILRGYPSLSKKSVQAALHWAGEMIDNPPLRQIRRAA